MAKVVLWSGGCDSTLVLDNLARNSSSIWPVETITILNSQIGVGNQQENEKKARDKYLAYAKKQGYHIKASEITITSDQRGLSLNYGLIQPMVWLFGASLYLKDKDKVYLGYIRGDDLWHYKQKFIETVNSIISLKHDSIEFVFPLEWKTKADIIEKLKKHDILKYTWYCENPKRNKACGKCHSCIVHQLGEYELAIKENRADGNAANKKV